MEKSGRKQVLKESELLARLAIVEGKLTSNQDRSAVSNTQLEILTRTLVEERVAGMAHSIEHFSSELDRIARVNEELESQIRLFQNED